MTSARTSLSRDPHKATDIRRSVAERLLPAALHPYARLARLDRPIGTWLLLLPCWWGLGLAVSGAGASGGGASGAGGSGVGASVWAAIGYGLWFALGALAMRGAGCTYNDIVDRDFDGRVARTALRPIPAGEVSVSRAWMFLALQLAVGAVVLFVLNPVAILIGFCSLPVVAAYPFAKRVTHWPQAVLGLAFNWGVLVGFAALTAGLTLSAALLYAAGLAWTLGYDTIYAHQDKEDDALIGVKSTALLFGARTRPWLVAFYGAATLLIAAAGGLAGLGVGFWIGLALLAAHFGWQVVALRLDDPDDCLAKFKANRDAGLIVTAALLFGGL
ncbi:MAG: 4-hydroxybenzoate octaprenyltransferase [Alphaproteobacteria bacterium]|nr:4-hydroxybenzoate octaprenyltransferase [Alphaproteobacteria bacterium]MCB9931119.1 4-hydroxybenzoate octaprenyltransferase [Alphaproteobacteria bacterium]